MIFIEPVPVAESRFSPGFTLHDNDSADTRHMCRVVSRKTQQLLVFIAASRITMMNRGELAPRVHITQQRTYNADIL